MSEAQFATLGRDDLPARKALLAAKEAADPKSVQRFQARMAQGISKCKSPIETKRIGRSFSCINSRCERCCHQL